MDYPSFSVLMSLYVKEKAEYFEECIESLLNQTVLPTEIVIVFDGPLNDELYDKVYEYVFEYPELFKIINNKKNQGLGLALADGIPACTYDLIARMDTDDIARKDRFETQLDEFIKNPGLDICGSFIDEFEISPETIVSRRKVPINDYEIKRYQKKRDAFNHMTVMYKKESVLKAGNYQSCPLMEDSLLWVNMMKSGAHCVNVPESLVFARIGKDMYKRRGGWNYFLKYKEGRKRILKTGYISYFDYFSTVSIQFLASLIPNELRGWVYKNILHR